MNNERQATLIKLAAVMASATRWIGALAASEGLYVPPEWMDWWRVLSFGMAASMAVVEAWAFAYALRAWRYMRPDSPQSKRLMELIVLAMVTFIAVMSPSIVSYVQHVEIDQVLFGAGLWIWGVAVTMSTISILMVVGYAQGRATATTGDTSNAQQATSNTDVSTSNDTSNTDVAKTYTCVDCGDTFVSPQKYAIHRRWAHVGGGNGKHEVGQETNANQV